MAKGKNAANVGDEFDETSGENDAAEDTSEETAAKAAKTPEEKQAHFVKVANRRLKVAIARLRSVAKLHSDNYTYTPEQGEKMIQVLQDELENLASLIRTRPDRSEQVSADIF